MAENKDNRPKITEIEVEWGRKWSTRPFESVSVSLSMKIDVPDGVLVEDVRRLDAMVQTAFRRVKHNVNSAAMDLLVKEGRIAAVHAERYQDKYPVDDELNSRGAYCPPNAGIPEPETRQLD